MIASAGILAGYTLMGVVLGVVFSLLFVRNDKQWVSFVTSAGSLGVLFAGYVSMNAFFTPLEGQRGWLLTFYLLGFLLSAMVFFYVFARVLKTQSEKITLRALDIILGRSKTLEEYYNDRRQEILGNLNAEELIRQKSELDQSVQRNQEILQEIKALENQCVNFEIKISTKYPVTSRFIHDMPQYVEKWAIFASEASGLTRDFVQRKKENKKLGKQELDAYFLGLCVAINKIFFANNPQAARSHVRILNRKEAVYRKIISVEGTSAVNKPMTDIPMDQGMIFHAFQEKASLIKSYNLKYHYGKVNSQWYDYLTIPLYGIEASVNGCYFPFISFGVAIQSGYHHEEMLVFLHLMKIEKFIQDQVKLLSDKTNIYETYNRNEGRE